MGTDRHCRWRKESYQFWTISGTSFLHFLLFGLAHISLLNNLSLARKWTSPLASRYIACFVVVFVSLISLSVGWRVPRARDLLPEVSENGTLGQYPISDKEYRSYCSAPPCIFQSVLLDVLLLKLAKRIPEACRTELARS